MQPLLRVGFQRSRSRSTRHRYAQSGGNRGDSRGRTAEGDVALKPAPETPSCCLCPAPRRHAGGGRAVNWRNCCATQQYRIDVR